MLEPFMSAHGIRITICTAIKLPPLQSKIKNLQSIISVYPFPFASIHTPMPMKPTAAI